MILTPSQQDAITVAAGILVLAAVVAIWPAEPEQSADKVHDHALEAGTPPSAESVRRWNEWIETCQAKPDCRRQLDELMSEE